MISKRLLFQCPRQTLSLLVILSACSSFPDGSLRPAEGQIPDRKIRIFKAVSGTGITVNPPVLHVAPGEGVVWINQTMHDVRINFEHDSVKAKGLSVIPRHSSVRQKFNEVGRYDYTLLFTASKTFGKVNGKIVVSQPEPQERPPTFPQENDPVPESPPGRMPEII